MRTRTKAVSWLVELGGVVFDSVENNGEQKVSITNPDGSLLTAEQARQLLTRALCHLPPIEGAASATERLALDLCVVHMKDAKAARADLEAVHAQAFEAAKRLALCRAELVAAKQHATLPTPPPSSDQQYIDELSAVLRRLIQYAEGKDTCPLCQLDNPKHAADCLVGEAIDLVE